MKYSEELVRQWANEIITRAKQSTTCSYVINYGSVDSFDPTDRECQRDVLEWIWDFRNLNEDIQAVDFNDINQLIIVVWYEPPIKEENKEEREMKKYTIEDYEQFSKEALDAPPIEQFEDGTINEARWYEENKIIVTKGQHQMELDYNADNVSEIDLALKEMYEVEMDIRNATTGNTIGSECRDATLKDILNVAIQNDWEDVGYKMGSLITFLRDFVKRYDDITNIMGIYDDVIYKDIEYYNDIFKCNFGKLDMLSLRHIDRPHIQRAIEELVGTDMELLVGYDKVNRCSDITFIMDHTFKPSGELIGWFYGEQDDEYIGELITDYKKKLFEEES